MDSGLVTNIVLLALKHLIKHFKSRLFHLFCVFKLNRISETLSLGKNPLFFMGEIVNLTEVKRKIVIFHEIPRVLIEN